MQLRRILMNAQDTSPGSGSSPPPAGTPATTAPATPPATPPAQGAALPTEAITQIVTQVRDGVFAELRRSGVLGTPKPPKPNTTPAPNGDAAPAAPPNFRALDRALTRTGRTNIDETAYSRLERAFSEEQPTNVEEWVTGYFQGFGVGAAASQPATTTTTPAPAGTPPTTTPPNGPPASDRGGTPAPKVPLEQQDLVSMQPTDREVLIKQKGLAWFNQTLMAQLKGRPVVVRR